MPHKAGVPRGGDGAHQGRVVDFLGVIGVKAPRIAGDMVVPEVCVVLLHRANQVTFHDLHVVGIVEQLDAGRLDRCHTGHPKGCVVALVVVVIDFAVEQLEYQVDTSLFGQRGELL